MSEFPFELSMYKAVRLNVENSKIETAISFYGNRISFEQTFGYIDRLADNISYYYGVGKGDCITLCMPNSPSALFAFYAANKAGAAVNLVHPYVPPAKLKEIAGRTRSKLIVLYDAYPHKKRELQGLGAPVLISDSSRFMGAAARAYYRLSVRKLRFGAPLEKYLFDCGAPRVGAADFQEEEPAVYLSSGGTGGEPKIIAHNNRSFNVLCSKPLEFLSEDLACYRSFYNVLPIFHGYGLCINMHMCMMIRRTSIMCLKFQAKRCAAQIVKERANVLTGVPAMYVKLLKEKKFSKGDLSSVKDAFVGGDGAPRELLEGCNAAFARGGSSARLFEGYGLTETIGACAVNSARHNRTGSAGFPLSGTRLRIVKEGKVLPAGEVGEIYIDTPQRMLGYLDCNEQPFEESDGVLWLKTGDLGYLDEEGFLYFKQRIKNMIKVSGVPVYPSEIEKVALGVAGVKRACAVGVSDPAKGQVVKLFLVAEKGNDLRALEKRVLAECRARLIAYAVPKFVEFRAALPLNLVGKIDRLALQREAQTQK